MGFELKGNIGSYSNGHFLFLGDNAECISLARLRSMIVGGWLRLEDGAEVYIRQW